VRELIKIHQEIMREAVSELLERLKEGEIKGEIFILLSFIIERKLNGR